MSSRQAASLRTNVQIIDNKLMLDEHSETVKNVSYLGQQRQTRLQMQVGK